jgi:hypothetical protein
LTPDEIFDRPAGQANAKKDSLLEEYENKDIFDLLKEAYDNDDSQSLNSSKHNSSKMSRRSGKDFHTRGEIDFAEGIETKRLMDGKLYDLDLLEMVEADEKVQRV